MRTIKSTDFDLNWNNTLSDYITVVNWSPDGSTLAMSSAAGEVKVFVENELITLQEVTNTSIDGLAFSTDGKFLAVGGQDGKVKIWNTSNYQLFAHSIVMSDTQLEYLGQGYVSPTKLLLSKFYLVYIDLNKQMLR